LNQFSSLRRVRPIPHDPGEEYSNLSLVSTRNPLDSFSKLTGETTEAVQHGSRMYGLPVVDMSTDQLG
jgi:hypothetical protein